MSISERSLKFLDLPTCYDKNLLKKFLQKAGQYENIVFENSYCIVTFRTLDECAQARKLNGQQFGSNKNIVKIEEVTMEELRKAHNSNVEGEKQYIKEEDRDEVAPEQHLLNTVLINLLENSSSIQQQQNDQLEQNVEILIKKCQSCHSFKEHNIIQHNLHTDAELREDKHLIPKLLKNAVLNQINQAVQKQINM